jgi:hypothetical protein
MRKLKYLTGANPDLIKASGTPMKTIRAAFKNTTADIHYTATQTHELIEISAHIKQQNEILEEILTAIKSLKGENIQANVVEKIEEVATNTTLELKAPDKKYTEYLNK